MAQQRLQLTWYNKDKALIPTETGKYGYTWVDPSDPRYCETHTLIMDDYVRGTQTPKTDEFAYSERANLGPQEDNLLILSESGDVLEALTRVPKSAMDAKLIELNDIVTPDQQPPVLSFKQDGTTYTFESPDDEGSGVADKDLSLFDLSVFISLRFP